MSPETGPGQNQKKTESKQVLEYKQESCTITLPWTLFMTGQKADWFIL